MSSIGLRVMRAKNNENQDESSSSRHQIWTHIVEQLRTEDMGKVERRLGAAQG